MSTPEADPTVRLTRPGAGVALIEIHRPAARNALDVATVARLGAAMDELEGTGDVRAVVLTGSGGHFSAGSDIKEMARLGVSCLLSAERVRGWARIESASLPLIAAVEGMALGAGLELALLADYILCDTTARFGLPELRLGVMPGDGGSQRLSRVIGQPRALRMILTSEIVGAEEAERLGLARCAEGSVREAALADAAKIAAGAPLAARMARSTVRAGADASLSSGLAMEARALEVLFATRDREEGMAAFIEKRPPAFKGE